LRRRGFTAVFPPQSQPNISMKKLLIALLSLSAASFALAGGEACKDSSKCDAKCTKECCKDAKACADAKDSKACPADKAACADKADTKKTDDKPAPKN